MYRKIHDLWESHELLMEGLILGALLLLLGGLILVPKETGLSPDIPSPASYETVLEAIEVPTAVAPAGTPGISVTHNDNDDERAGLLQDITKVNQEMKVLKDMSVSVTATIQKTCGGQTNACAKNLQGTLEENARKYDDAEVRLRALTAALGNLP